MEEKEKNLFVLNRDMIDAIDNETISYCEREGNRYIDGQVQIGREIRNKSIAFLGMITAVLVTLAGTAVVNIVRSETHTLIFFLNIYGIMAFGIIAYKLIKGIIYDKPTKISGNKPSYILQKRAIDYVKEQAKKAKAESKSADSYKYIVSMQINAIQEKIEFNKNVNEQLQKNFKSCMRQLYVFAILIVPFLLLCWLIE